MSQPDLFEALQGWQHHLFPGCPGESAGDEPSPKVGAEKTSSQSPSRNHMMGCHGAWKHWRHASTSLQCLAIPYSHTFTELELNVYSAFPKQNASTSTSYSLCWSILGTSHEKGPIETKAYESDWNGTKVRPEWLYNFSTKTLRQKSWFFLMFLAFDLRIDVGPSASGHFVRFVSLAHRGMSLLRPTLRT